MSRSKDNQTMKLGQVIYNTRNIFLEKSYPKCGAEISHRPSFRKSNFCISLDQQSKVLYSLFVQVEGYRNILKLTCRLVAFTSYKAF